MVNQITDRLHVSTSNFGVVRAAYKAFNRKTQIDPALRSTRFQFYKECISRHAENRGIFTSVMSGRI